MLNGFMALKWALKDAILNEAVSGETRMSDTILNELK